MQAILPAPQHVSKVSPSDLPMVILPSWLYLFSSHLPPPIHIHIPIHPYIHPYTLQQCPIFVIFRFRHHLTTSPLLHNPYLPTFHGLKLTADKGANEHRLRYYTSRSFFWLLFSPVLLPSLLPARNCRWDTSRPKSD